MTGSPSSTSVAVRCLPLLPVRRLLPLVLLVVTALLPSLARAAEEQAGPQFPLGAKRILFIGDSITHAGHYVAWIDTQLRLQGTSPLPEIIGIGLGSETCSGLSEPDHPFPRPDVHERLDRALEQIQPDVVVSCYGMNDGIYHPFSEERFAAYQQGVRKIQEKVHAAGAKLILMTPTPFDTVPLEGKGKLKPAGEEKYAYFAMYEGYDDVLARYGKWILTLKDEVALVIDLRTPLAEHAAEQRKKNPKFTLIPDGIHPNKAGHRIMGETILRAWGLPSTVEPSPKLLELMTRRTALVHDAWLSAVGHKRPGIRAGLPLAEAKQKAAELDAQIAPLVEAQRQLEMSQRASTGGEMFQVHYPAEAGAGKLKIAADYSLWIPAGVKQLRGVIVHQHGCGVGACTGGKTAADDLHWQALAKKWDCALMGPAYEPLANISCRLWCDPRNGSDERFRQALADLADSSGHAELTEVPWCLWGHSGGGFWASLMQTLHPEKIVAIWFRSGTAFAYWTRGETAAPEIPAAAYDVPMIGNPGLREKGDRRFKGAWDGLTDMRAAYLKEGAFFEFAPDPRTAHECGDSRYMAIPFFDFWLQHRLPAAGETELKSAAAGRKLWADTMAAKLAEYVEQGSLADDTPPPAPSAVKAVRNDDGTVTVTWQAEADFESGIRGFVIERAAGEEFETVGSVPETPKGRFGRPLFQAMSYHDTPEAPLPEMKFIDPTAPKTGELPVYRVRTVNSVELQSAPTASR